MAKATWNGKVIAESDTTEMVEGNIYFPESSLKREYFRPSSTISTCPWKGQARYYSLLVDGQENQDAAWYYPDPKPAARNVKNHVAFWRGVEVEKKLQKGSLERCRRALQPDVFASQQESGGAGDRCELPAKRPRGNTAFRRRLFAG